MHTSFSNLAADQDFLLDDVIKELARLRECNFASLKRHFEKVTAAVESKTPEFLRYGDSQRTDRLVNLHNALLIAQSLKEKGEATIKLNPKKDLVDQLLVKVDHNKGNAAFGSENSFKVGFRAAQARLAK